MNAFQSGSRVLLYYRFAYVFFRFVGRGERRATSEARQFALRKLHHMIDGSVQISAKRIYGDS
ncbi:MAG: hypothetical protein OYG31_02045 [Candidatus Kaiserbacteria bacterium]|nr:hypothetical protein [Candidatus Kaiserbacteria bacterium]